MAMAGVILDTFSTAAGAACTTIAAHPIAAATLVVAGAAIAHLAYYGNYDELNLYIQSRDIVHLPNYTPNHMEKIGNFLLIPISLFLEAFDYCVVNGRYVLGVHGQSLCYPLDLVARAALCIIFVVATPFALIALCFKVIGERNNKEGEMRRKFAYSYFEFHKNYIRRVLLENSEVPFRGEEEKVAAALNQFLASFKEHIPKSLSPPPSPGSYPIFRQFFCQEPIEHPNLDRNYQYSFLHNTTFLQHMVHSQRNASLTDQHSQYLRPLCDRQFSTEWRAFFFDPKAAPGNQIQVF